MEKTVSERQAESISHESAVESRPQKKKLLLGVSERARRSGESELTRQVDDSADVQEMVPTKLTGCMYLVGDYVDPIVGIHWFYRGESSANRRVLRAHTFLRFSLVVPLEPRQLATYLLLER